MRLRLWNRERKHGFAAEMVESFPEGLQPPDPLVQFFEWQELNGLNFTQEGETYARLDPDQPDFCMYTNPVDARFAETWYEHVEPAQRARIAPFVRTGGDGSVAALWRDDRGELAFVHLGSGSGSTMLCILTRDPVDFLRLLAIGYDELCWPEWYSEKPEDAHREAFEALGDDPYVRRSKLRTWVEETFAVTVPQRASEIVAQTADMDDEISSDAFWQWDKSLQGLTTDEGRSGK